MELQRDVQAAGASGDDVQPLLSFAAQSDKKWLRAALGAAVIVALAIASVMTFSHQKLRAEPVN